MKKKLIIIALLSIILLSMMGGCQKTPTFGSLKIVKIEIPNYGVVDAPKDIVISWYWHTYEDKITITFNKDIDTSQETPLFFYGSGIVDTVLPERQEKERVKPVEDLYYIYHVDKNRIIIQRISSDPGLLPSYDVTLFIPKEIRARDGTTLQEDAFFFLNRYYVSLPPAPPQLVIAKDPDVRAETGAMDTIMLPMTLSEKRTFAFIIKETNLMSSPGIDGKKLKSLVIGNNVEIEKNTGNWTKVKVYYPKYSIHDKKIESISLSFEEILDSNLVEKVIGYIPSESLQIIPRPHNPSTYVTISICDIGMEEKKLAVAFTVHTFSAGSTGYVPLGERITEDQLWLLEISALAFVPTISQHWVAAAGYSDKSGKRAGNIITFFQLNWTEEEHKIFKRVFEGYNKKILNLLDAYKVNAKYERRKEIIHKESEFRAKLNEAIFEWMYADKERKTENLAKYVIEAIATTEEEKKEIYEEITTKAEHSNGAIVYEGLFNVINSKSPFIKADLGEEIRREKNKLFKIGL